MIRAVVSVVRCQSVRKPSIQDLTPYTRRMRKLVATAVLVLAAGSAGTGGQQPVLRSGISLTAFDRSARPQDDFFQFVNGGWLARTTIPPDRRVFGTFEILRESSREKLRALLENPSRAGQLRDRDWQRVADFYGSFMNEVSVNAAGVSSLATSLKDIDAIRTP